MTELTTRFRTAHSASGRNGQVELSPMRALGRRLALSTAALVGSFVLLEGVARALLPVPAPIQLRDGIYLNTLPLVNGLSMDRGELPQTGAYLPEKKGEHELRVFVFGESSAVGGPWGYAAASATHLHDLMKKAWPDRVPTVVNMGRSGSYTLDAWYYLLLSARFSPDVVIFYGGNNDRYDVDAEMCLPGEHPWLHALWGKAVAHSWLLWNVRVLGPARLGYSRTVGAGGPAKEHCAPDQAFAGWAEALVATASDLGAQIIVSLPVSSTAAELDLWEAGGAPGKAGKVAPEALSPEFKQLLTCRLTPTCDFPAALDAELSRKQAHGFKTFEMQTLNARMAGLRDAASRHGAQVVDLGDALRAQSPRGILGPPLIFDEVHLSPEGYWILASRWMDTLIPMITGSSAAHSGAPRPARPADDPAWQAYQPQLRAAHQRRLVFEGLRYLEQWRPLLATSMLLEASETYQNAQAQVALGWIRLQLGLSSDLPPELEAKARAYRTSQATPPPPGGTIR